MDANVKKTALRMIPYGLYVLTGESKDGRVAATTVNWVTQASFLGRMYHPKPASRLAAASSRAA